MISNQQSFIRIEKPNIFSWNTMIRFFAGFNPMIAVHYCTKMLREEMRPDRYTFPFLLQIGGGPSFDLGFVKQVHCHALKSGFGHSLFVQNSLINAYVVRDSAMEARKVFDEMPERDVVTWTSLISGLVAQSNPGRSWIQIRDAVHEFVARHDVDPQTMELHMVLDSLEKLSRL